MGSKPEEKAKAPNLKLRDQRFTSHALIEVKKSKFLPFNVLSAVLLDISLGGVKVELTGNTPVATGGVYWLDIPLAPLHIFAPERLQGRCEIRWFDKERYRFGGSLKELNNEKIEIINHIIYNMEEIKRERGQTQTSA